jgi:hypothetical protein
MSIRFGLRFLLACGLLVLPAGLAAQTYTIEPWLSAPREPSEWDFDGSGTWEISNGKIMLTKAGAPEGPVGRPAALAIVRMDPLTKATVGMRARSTAPADVPAGGFQMVVGYQSPTRFYYVDVSSQTDPAHNGIFLVDGANVRRIDRWNGEALLRDQAWHDVRVEFDGTSGIIRLFLDHKLKPTLSAYDATLQEGRIGVGSFDDTAEFRAIRVSGSR